MTIYDENFKGKTNDNNFFVVDEYEDMENKKIKKSK